MIGYLKGKIIEVLPTRILLDVNGVGYEVLIPLSFNARLTVDSDVALFAHLAIRDDAHVLYGFQSREERDFFRTLIQSVSGIGPKMGLNILSAMPLDRFKSAVVNEDVKAISSIPGIGKKTAERLLVEMKDKVGIPSGTIGGSGSISSGGSSQLHPIDESIQALIALQMKPAEAQSLVEKAIKKLGEDASTEDIVRACLQKS